MPKPQTPGAQGRTCPCYHISLGLGVLILPIRCLLGASLTADGSIVNSVVIRAGEPVVLFVGLAGSCAQWRAHLTPQAHIVPPSPGSAPGASITKRTDGSAKKTPTCSCIPQSSRKLSPSEKTARLEGRRQQPRCPPLWTQSWLLKKQPQQCLSNLSRVFLMQQFLF